MAQEIYGGGGGLLSATGLPFAISHLPFAMGFVRTVARGGKAKINIWLQIEVLSGDDLGNL